MLMFNLKVSYKSKIIRIEMLYQYRSTRKSGLIEILIAILSFNLELGLIEISEKGTDDVKYA